MRFWIVVAVVLVVWGVVGCKKKERAPERAPERVQERRESITVFLPYVPARDQFIQIRKDIRKHKEYAVDVALWKTVEHPKKLGLVGACWEAWDGRVAQVGISVDARLLGRPALGVGQLVFQLASVAMMEARGRWTGDVWWACPGRTVPARWRPLLVQTMAVYVEAKKIPIVPASLQDHSPTSIQRFMGMEKDHD